MTVEDLLIKYPLEQAVREAGLNTAITDNLQHAIKLLEEIRPKILVIEGCLLKETEEIISLQHKVGKVKVVIIGEPSCSEIFENAFNISKPLNCTYLVSQLKLILQQ